MARAIWSGSISFGLVNVPVELHRAERRSDLHFELVDSRDRARIRYERVNEETGEEVPWDSVVKGYEYKDGNFVLLSEADFKEVRAKATKLIEIEEFVKKDEIDVMYYDRPYYLVPGKRGEKGYVLLREALERTGMAGISKIVIRTREYLCAMMAREDAIVVMLMRFHQELLPAEELNIPTRRVDAYKITPGEIKLAEQLIKAMAKPWKPERYKDDYRQSLMAWIREKVKRGDTDAAEPTPEAEEETTEETSIVNLMDMLVKSVEQNKRGRRRSSSTRKKVRVSHRRPARRKRA